MTTEHFTIVAAVNNRRILEANLLQSPDLRPPKGHQILIKEDFASALLAYNSALAEARNDLLYVCPPGRRCLHPGLRISTIQFNFSSAPTPLGGCSAAWVRHLARGGVGKVYSTGWGLQGHAVNVPEVVETLDEIVLIVRKSSGLRFDPQLPHFHMYGVDLCLSARSKGLVNYVLPAFCIHNTNQLLELPKEFHHCYHYVKKKWQRYLPIHTSCTQITRFDFDIRKRKVEHLVDRLLGKQRTFVKRADDPRSLLTADQIKNLSVRNSLFYSRPGI